MLQKIGYKGGSYKFLFTCIILLLTLSVLSLSLPVCRGGEKVQTKRAGQPVSPFVDRKLLGLFTHSTQNHMNGLVPASQRGSIRNPRIYVHWGEVEYKRGAYSWAKTDAEVNAALGMGIESVFITLGGSIPKWAQNPNWPGKPGIGLPLYIADWQNFCKAVAAHYKGYVDYYQIWQEPGWDINAPPAKEGVTYFNGDAKWNYITLLRAGYNGIKAADPKAYVMSGSLLQGLTRQQSDFENYEILLSGSNQDVSMRVDAGQNIVAERPMYFNYHGAIKDGTVELGSKQPRNTWYLAEGATHSGFEEWICIQNPGNIFASVAITYMFPGGKTQLQSISVPPKSRTTVDVNAAVGPDKDVSARVSSNKPIVVERPLYFLYHGAWDGGSVGSGVPELSKVWFLAEGATQPGFQTWISLMNPGANLAHVKITYMFPNGETQVQQISMAPTSRETVLVNDIVGPNKDVSAKVEASEPVIAERPMYFLYHNAWSGGDSQVGATTPANSWFFSEGTTRSNQYDGAFEEWISIQNPGEKPAHVNFTYMFQNGATQSDAKTVAPHSRETILVNNVVGPDKDVSVQLDSDQGIIAERPMYFNYHNKYDGGDVELGCTALAKTWYFAEGTTRAGFEEWLTLQNPSLTETTATISFMFGDSTTGTKHVTLPPKSRTTVGINDSVSMAAYCDGVAVNPYQYPQYWVEYYNKIKNICMRHGYENREVVISEIGWPHASTKNPGAYSPEGQRAAICEQGIAPLFNAGCRKIWIYEDVDDPPGTSWDAIDDGLFYYGGNPTPAWNEYKKWQQQLPDYPNLPSSLMVAVPGVGQKPLQ